MIDGNQMVKLKMRSYTNGIIQVTFNEIRVSNDENKKKQNSW